MALFKQILNPMTHQNESNMMDDYFLEVANTGFGDMLHDWERNEKYFAALRKVITQMHAEGREAHVLDIGTGTGLLSMMAVKAGADSVTACEAFVPMANCAERILSANGMGGIVRLIKKRSTEMKIGTDMPNRANLLVAEVLDSELIGEGAIGIYNHAHEELLTNDVVCIPSKATCYAQIMESSMAQQWNSLKSLPNLDGEILIEPPHLIADCRAATLHDVQLSQIPMEKFKPITNPVEIFIFDFNRKEKRETERTHNVIVKSISPGSTDLVFYWWSINLDLEGDIVVSCAPFWDHPLTKQAPNKMSKHAIPWRDHWMQIIYYIPKPLRIDSTDTEFGLNCNHDEFSLFFDVHALDGVPTNESRRDRACSCIFHMAYSHTRIGQLNDGQRNKRFLNYLEEVIQKDSHVLCLGDGNILGLATSKMGAASVLICEPHSPSRCFMELVINENKLENVHVTENINSREIQSMLLKVTHIFAEPHFLNSIVPWDNFYFGNLLHSLQDRLPSAFQVSPHSARIVAVPVEFENLHKFRAPIGTCEGFNLSIFDEMIETSSTLAQAKVEAQPLWEYPCRALAQPQTMLDVVFGQFENDMNEGSIVIEHSGSCNGIAMWVDWNIDGGNSINSIVSTGPTEPIKIGQFINWDMFTRQGVHLIRRPHELKERVSRVHWLVQFRPVAGEILFSFDIKP